MLVRKIFLECSWYFSRMHLYVLYIVMKFQAPSYNTFWDINFFLVWFLVQSHTDRQTQSDAYEPTVHMQRWAQKMWKRIGIIGMYGYCSMTFAKGMLGIYLVLQVLLVLCIPCPLVYGARLVSRWYLFFPNKFIFITMDVLASDFATPSRSTSPTSPTFPNGKPMAQVDEGVPKLLYPWQSSLFPGDKHSQRITISKMFLVMIV